VTDLSEKVGLLLIFTLHDCRLVNDNFVGFFSEFMKKLEALSLARHFGGLKRDPNFLVVLQYSGWR
jgi:hypothetical protein